MTAAAAPPPVPGKASARSLRRIGEKPYAGYLFILPHFLLFLFMVGLPFFYNLVHRPRRTTRSAVTRSSSA